MTDALKKLTKLGLVAGGKKRKETFFRTIEEGRDVCQRYAEIREACLVYSPRHSALPAKTRIRSPAHYAPCPDFTIRRRGPQRRCKATGSGERNRLISE